MRKFLVECKRSSPGPKGSLQHSFEDRRRQDPEGEKQMAKPKHTNTPTVIELVLATAEGEHFTLSSLNTTQEWLRRMIFGKRTGRINYRGLSGSVVEVELEVQPGLRKMYITTFEAAERFGYDFISLCRERKIGKFFWYDRAEIEAEQKQLRNSG